VSLVSPTAPFSLLPYLERAIEDDAAAGLQPLRFFNLDLERVAVPGVWRPSRLHRCMRANLYKLFDSPRDEHVTFDPVQQNNFMRGHLLGAYAAAVLRLLDGRWGFSDFVDEGIAHDEASSIGGKKDVTFRKDGVKYVVEVKSKLADIQDDMKPEKDHLLQLNEYLHAEKLPMGFLIYVGPKLVPGTKMKRLWFVEKLQRYSRELWEESHSRTLQLTWFRRDPSRLAPATGSRWNECPTCPWRESCERGLSPLQLDSGLSVLL